MKHNGIIYSLFLSLLATAVLLPATAFSAYDMAYIGETKTIEAKEEDTFVYIARDYNLGYLDMVLANPEIDPWLPDEGTELIIPSKFILPDAPREGIVINLAEMRLYAFLGNKKEPLTFPIGVGREGLETPTGTTTVLRKQANPIWRPTPRMRQEDPTLPEVVYPGPDNPLGTHAMYLGWSQYLIHGTNKPFGIGRRSSSGCIRMYPESIIKIFDLVEPNTKVTVVSQPIKAAWIGEELYVEAHPTMQQATEIEDKGIIQSYPLTDEDKAWITRFAGIYADMLDWDMIEEMGAKRTGIPTSVFNLKDIKKDQDKKDKKDSKKKKNDKKEADKAADEKKAIKKSVEPEAEKPATEKPKAEKTPTAETPKAENNEAEAKKDQPAEKPAAKKSDEAPKAKTENANATKTEQEQKQAEPKPAAVKAKPQAKKPVSAPEETPAPQEQEESRPTAAEQRSIRTNQ